MDRARRPAGRQGPAERRDPRGQPGPYGGVGGTGHAGGRDRQRGLVRVEFEYGGVVVAGREQGLGDVVGGQVDLGGEPFRDAVGEPDLHVPAGGAALVGEQVQRLDGGLGAEVGGGVSFAVADRVQEGAHRGEGLAGAGGCRVQVAGLRLGDHVGGAGEDGGLQAGGDAAAF